MKECTQLSITRFRTLVCLTPQSIFFLSICLFQERFLGNFVYYLYNNVLQTLHIITWMYLLNLYLHQFELQHRLQDHNDQQGGGRYCLFTSQPHCIFLAGRAFFGGWKLQVLTLLASLAARIVLMLAWKVIGGELLGFFPDKRDALEQISWFLLHWIGYT